MPDVLDPVPAIMSRLLTCVDDRLVYYEVPTCRSFWAPTSAPAWDACGKTDAGAEGMLWVGIESRFPTDNFPQPVAGAHRCRPSEFGLNIVVGILRCAHTIDDDGIAPSAEEISSDSLAQSRDAWIIEQAILCCFIDEDTDPGDFRLGNWESLGPNGGCVGGQWRLQKASPVCRCVDVPEPVAEEQP